MNKSIAIQSSEVSRETLDIIHALILEHETKINCYAERLKWWNARINLLSRNVGLDEIHQHIRHSLYLHTYLKFEKNVVDAGSGGGLPGIPIAMADENKSVTLVDIVGKKMLACESMAIQCGLKNVRTVKQSIGDYEPVPDSVLVSKHAFKIPELLKMIEGKSYSKIILLKGDDYREELKTCGTDLHVDVHTIDAIEPAPFFKGKCIVTIKLISA